MHKFEPQKFNIPALDGISDKSVEEHLGLYAGYVKNFNSMTDLLQDLAKDSEKNMHALSELIRRRSFEFGGMRLHEHYFSQFEKGPKEADQESSFAKAIAKQYGSIDSVIMQLTHVGNMRGPGWSILYFDPQSQSFHIGFTGEQHQGHFVTLPIMIALDVWEHAFLLDYGAAGKGKYIDAFFKNLNWSVIENRFANNL
jgi:superoxide dismutase, Fe-Mn family